MLSCVAAWATSDKDSIALLPPQEVFVVESMYKQLDNGKHPSDFQFAVENASPRQVQAWLEGDYDQLHGTFLMDDFVSGKGDFFSNAQENIGLARKAIAEVQEIGNFISQFDGSSLITLPVGMEKELDDGTQIFVVIDRISLYPTHAEVAVYARVKTPKMLDPIFFGSPDIQFTRKSGVKAGSLGLLGDTRCKIFEDVAVLEFIGAKVQNNEFMQGQGNYVTFDCDGLSEFSLDVDLTFNRKVIRPAFPIDSTEVVRAELDVLAQNTHSGLNNILISIDIDQPFVSPKKPDVIFRASNIKFDFSELAHDTGMPEFPIADYTPALAASAETLPLWQGVYIGELSVQLPDQLIGDQGPSSIGITDVIIDQTGFTGWVGLSPVLALDQGDMSGWAFSIDYLNIHFLQNDLVAFNFNGNISIPLLNDDPNGSPSVASSLGYHAWFDWENDTYAFDADLLQDQQYHSKMLKADLTISANSTLSVSYQEGNGFDVMATLHGSLAIDANVGSGTGGGLSLQVPEVTFDNVVIKNRGNIIEQAGNWDVENLVVNVGDFALHIDGIAMETGEQPEEAVLKFQAGFILGTEEVALAANGFFRVIGKIEESNTGRQNWRYDRFIVDALFVDCETEAFDFNGYIIFFDNIESDGGTGPDYGKGFQGKLALTLKKLKEGVGFEAMGLFGKVNDYNYFMVDVMAKFPATMINVAGLDIRAIGGGVYVNMRQEEIADNFSSAPTDDVLENYNGNGSQQALDNYKNSISNYLGRSLSGTKYYPTNDSNYKLGITAGIVIATPDEETFNANVRLNLVFNEDGGFTEMGLSGYANVMAPISWTGPSCEGVSLEFDLRYESGNITDSGEPRFIGWANAYVNLNGITGGLGDPITDGDCSPLYRAGGVDILISDTDWYINIGIPASATTPNTGGYANGPITLDVQQLGIEATAYLDVGTNIPTFPGLPDNVAELTGLSNLIQDENVRASGNGFAFGARLVVDNNFDAWGILEADIYLDVGFDIMVQKYNDVFCVNTGQELGINGWYAAGQAWVYADGNLKVAGFEILDAGVAAAIQVKGPRPFYGRGAVVGRYNVAGGLFKGDFRFPLEFGQECELEDGVELELDVNMISTVLPLDGTSNVPVETKPVAEFTYPMSEIVELNLDGTQPAFYMIQMEGFEVHNEVGALIEGQLHWVEEAYVLEFRPYEILDGNTEYTITVNAALYATNENGSIVGDPLQTEVRTHIFTTGPSLNHIPLSNVSSAWPANEQFNYYQGEPVDNFLQLSAGQDDLFFYSSDYQLVLELTDGSSTPPVVVQCNYNSANNKITFDLPTLPNNKCYKAELKIITAGANDFGGGGIGGGGSFGGGNNSNEDEVLLTYYFRVSFYNTLADKMADMTGATLQEDGTNIYTTPFTNLLEPFGLEEIVGVDWLPATLTAIMDHQNTSWFQQFLNIPVPGVGSGSFNLYGITSPTSCSDCTTGNLAYGIGEFNVMRPEFSTIPVEAVALLQPNVELMRITEEKYSLFNAAAGNGWWPQNWAQEYHIPSFYYAVPKIIDLDYYYMRVNSMDQTAIDLMELKEDQAMLLPCDFGESLWTCCQNNQDVMDDLYFYLTTASFENSFKYFHSFFDPGDSCHTSLIENREIDVSLDTGTSYPIIIKGKFAPNYEGNTTFDLQY